MSHNMYGLNKLREIIKAEKPFTDAEAIVKAFEEQGCKVRRPVNRFKEYEITTNLGDVKLLITLWPRASRWMHFMVCAIEGDEQVEGVEFTVNEETRVTDVFGVTLGPCLPVKEHGRIHIKLEGEEKELTW